MCTKNDVAWEKLFAEHKILERIDTDGIFYIRSEEINRYREARLMAKFDHENNLPKIFRRNDITILPVSRGQYALGRFAAYYPFEDSDSVPVEYVNFPEVIESIQPGNISSEAVALNCAYSSGIIQDFLGEEMMFPTISGRMSSGDFSFNVRAANDFSNYQLDVSNSQVEIDAGYEGASKLALIEAKNSISKDFIIRQLYYPYALWTGRIYKEVCPVFLVYTNGIFHLYEYAFDDSAVYNSIRLVKQRKYCLEEQDISLDDIQTAINQTKYVDEPKEYPFPQADSFERIINLCELLYDNQSLSKDETTTTYDFTPRQTQYYTSAGAYLGFINKEQTPAGVTYFLTEQGRKLFGLKHKQRQLAFVRAIVCHEVFAKTLLLYLKKADLPSKEEVVDVMKSSRLNNIDSESTYRRRASTVLSWCNWVLGLIH
jgi:hypothetical protein